MTEQRTMEQPATDERIDGDEARANRGQVVPDRAPLERSPQERAMRETMPGGAPAGPKSTAAIAQAGHPGAGRAGTTPLFDDAATRDLHDRWSDVQAAFVDEPRSSVERADALVAEVMQRLAKGFSAERKRLEDQWSRGDDVSTEDLRVALRRYRSFFDRLLSV